ncbi:MAG: MotA/TolQ/ExbB proton channel family protein [Fuerstiella sp.]|nr:MotA/TolQ/ExbB proton channel family protein [Fuerstiella sp.]
MSSWNSRVLTASTFLLLAGLLPLLSADEVADAAPAPPVAEVAEESPPADDSILSLMLATGLTGLLFMGALGLFSLVSVTVAIERLVNTRRVCIVPADLVSELKRVVDSDRSTPADLQTVCDRHEVPIATILNAGLQRAGRPLPEVEKAMEDAAVREMGALRSRVRPLTVAGSVAPLIGLLGTVVGMIIAFKTASQAGLGKGEMLAQGIYMALVTTAAGLSIAIPSLLCAAFFNGKIEQFFREIDVALMSTFPCFARVEKRVVSASQAPEEDDKASARTQDSLVDVS